ncbi:hypothetical protein Leryth_025240 [Lithospermum erythrorhizon]|nr:hypothetical protein Leryth_025240 [Lithospermum erythrorhizon]
MATATYAQLSIRSFFSPPSLRQKPPLLTTSHHLPLPRFPTTLNKLSSFHTHPPFPFLTCRTSNMHGGGSSGSGGGGGGSGGGSSGNDDDDEHAGNKNREEAMMALAEGGRSLESIPKDLAGAIEDGRIPASIVDRFLELQKSPIMRWLIQFGGFRERLLADDLFLTKVAIECGVGIFTKVCYFFGQMH